MNVLVTVLVVLLVTLATAQSVIFYASDKTRKERWDLHNVIAKLGLVAAGYTLFFARIHLSPGVWIGLVVTRFVVPLLSPPFEANDENTNEASW